MKVPRERRRPHIEFKFTITTNHITRTNQPRRRIDGIRIVRSAHTTRRRHRPSVKFKRHGNARMKIQTLHDRGRNYRSATSVTYECSRVEGSLFAAHTFGGG